VGRLDLRSIVSCNLFPGQVIGVEGSNLDGKKLVAHRLFDDARPLRPLSVAPPSPSIEVKVLIAAGPFNGVGLKDVGPTPPICSANHSSPRYPAPQWSYQSSVLPTIVEVAKVQAVHAVILLGPFVDAQVCLSWLRRTEPVPAGRAPFFSSSDLCLFHSCSSAPSGMGVKLCRRAGRPIRGAVREKSVAATVHLPFRPPQCS
jgi:hypothetical protein